jgi:hypothetical protein
MFCVFGYTSVGMVTDAGVFRELAIWAIRQIEGELFDKGFGIRGGLDLDDDWEVVASGDALIGKKAVVIFGKGHLDRSRPLAGCDDDDLVGGRDGLASIIDKGDLNLAIRCKKKFGVRLYGFQNAAAIGSGDFLFMAMVIARLERKRAEEGDGE